MGGILIIAFWIAVAVYVLGVFFIGIAALVEYSTAYGHEGRVKAARLLLSVPVWPIYWGKRLIIVIAEAIELTREKERE